MAVSGWPVNAETTRLGGFRRAGSLGVAGAWKNGCRLQVTVAVAGLLPVLVNEEFWRYRVGDQILILIVEIAHRREAYHKL